VKSHQQAAFFVRSIQCIDLTTLDGADTETNVRRLCAKAARPLTIELVDKLGLKPDSKEEAKEDVPLVHTGAICVYASRVADAVKALKALPGGDRIGVASVATGFPAGQTPLNIRLEEIRYAVAQGATEIDIVLNRALVIAQDWRGLYDEVWQMRDACGDAHLKTILAVGDLPTFRDVMRSSIVCMCAGADFIKTSTGKESVNATLAGGFVMCRALREYHEKTGFRVGFKPAGGIRSAKDCLSWLSMMADECGEPWTHPDLFRIGASTLLGDLERQLTHCVSGKYSADRYVPMS
jgi:deoxyribose-phosphate aldolase